jgi:hypothetical protein
MVGQKSPKQGRFVRSKGDTVQRMSRGIQKGRKQGHFGRWGVGVGLCVMMLVAACDPPGKKACSEDRQCSMGEYCDPKDNRCAVGCSDDSRCATGEACHKNKCKLRICTPDATNTPPNGEPCYTGNPSDISEVIQKAVGRAAKEGVIASTTAKRGVRVISMCCQSLRFVTAKTTIATARSTTAQKIASVRQKPPALAAQAP